MAHVHLVTPGERITQDVHYMRGHGTYQLNGALYSSVVGVVHKVNKLISVRPLRARYNGEIGDVVVGRITEVAQNRWKVDCNAKLDGVLMLASVNLPGGVLRRRSQQDELTMREFLKDGDLVSAEVQSTFSDGSLSLHTRNMKYGKLTSGTFITVPPSLVKRCKNHFHKLPCGVSVILGVNGFCWITTRPANDSANGLNGVTNPVAGNADNKEQSGEVSASDRENIARVRNCICALSTEHVLVYDTSLIFTYDSSLQYSVGDLLKPDVIADVVQQTRAKIQAHQ